MAAVVCSWPEHINPTQQKSKQARIKLHTWNLWVLLAGAACTVLFLLIRYHVMLTIYSEHTFNALHNLPRLGSLKSDCLHLDGTTESIKPAPHQHPLLCCNSSISFSNTTSRACSCSCAETTSTHHNAVSLQGKEQQPNTQLQQDQHHLLTKPRDADATASRAAIQAYLASPEFAAARPRLLLGRGTAAWQSDTSQGQSEQVPAETPSHQQKQQHARAGAEKAAGGSDGSGGSDGRGSRSRGILVVAGGRKLLTHLVVQLKVLRGRLGCKLPVEVAWQGPKEMDNVTFAALQREFGPLSGFDIQTVSYPAHIRRVPLKRWVGKVAALLYCSFKEVLLLDCDNLPLQDPSYLFEDPLYLQHHNLLWPDFWADWVKPGTYPWLGLNETLVQPLLAAGAGHTGRDAESGMLLLDRGRWLEVLYWVFWINSWHDRLYYRLIHGDKDTFALGFALAGHADKYRQVSVPPGGVFRWGKNQLEIKCKGPAGSCNTTDGWQLLGAMQHDDTGRPAFFHRTMNKLDQDQQPWKAELVTGPLPTRWLQYYLAHNSLGPTKGVWWEHVAPNSAFTLLSGLEALGGTRSETRGHAVQQLAEDKQVLAGITNSQTGSRHWREGMHHCPAQLYKVYVAAHKAALPIDAQPILECLCQGQQQALQQPGVVPLQLQQLAVATERHKALQRLGCRRSKEVQQQGYSSPVAAARVTESVLQLSGAMQVVEASLSALEWLKSPEGKATFPSLAPGSAMQ